MINAKAHVTEMESGQNKIFCRQEELLEEGKRSHAEQITAWKNTSAENTDTRTGIVNVTKVQGDKISVKRNAISVSFGEHVSSMKALANANVNRKVTLTDIMTKV